MMLLIGGYDSGKQEIENAWNHKKRRVVSRWSLHRKIFRKNDRSVEYIY
ncbi:hypothetical protein CCHR01_01311 [Colletotrichum chrysophilum]|uniref:Uncharacterized protein n=1 Tax=Colletotrichum chrysophilum TaxID=1836956 RepID=A0AAD9EQJ5_9PEZI|nr:hypothetical protein CCHR01_01311 [Colletotrichum chrysophilum]